MGKQPQRRKTPIPGSIEPSHEHVFYVIPLVIFGLIMLVVAPYNKVEESFITQASHDILFSPPKREKNTLEPLTTVSAEGWGRWDHLTYPGVVPRSFFGPGLVTAIAAPFIYLFDLLGLLGPNASGASCNSAAEAHLFVRAALLLLWATAMSILVSALSNAGHRSAARWFVILSLVQFHPQFYASRLLPNSFATVAVILAAAAYTRAYGTATIILITIATVVFRCDMAILGAAFAVVGLWRGVFRLVDAVVTATLAITVCLFITVPVDSYLWGRLLWPEGAVLSFNSGGRSSEWGAMPWAWYFTSALPRALLIAYPMAMLAIVLPTAVLRSPQSSSRPPVGRKPGLLGKLARRCFDGSADTSAPVLPATRDLGVVALLFVIVYSFLPHKELRFLLPVYPLFTVVAAEVASALWEATGLSTFRRVVRRVGIVFMLVLSLGAVIIHCSASSTNYPGGVAMQRLHEEILPRYAASRYADGSPVEPFIYLDVGVTMTGVSRFGKAIHSCSNSSGYVIHYSKDPNLFPDDSRKRGRQDKGTHDTGVSLYSSSEDSMAVRDRNRVTHIICSNPAPFLQHGFGVVPWKGVVNGFDGIGMKEVGGGSSLGVKLAPKVWILERDGDGEEETSTSEK